MSKQEKLVDGEVSLDEFNDLFNEDTEIIQETEQEETQEGDLPEPEKEVEYNTETISEKKTEESDEQEEQEQEEVKDVLEDTSTSSYTKVQALIELGELDDILVSTVEGEEPRPISEIKDLSESQFEAILEDRKSKKQKEQEEKFISKEGLADHQLRIVNILKNGGSLKEIFSDPDKGVKRPFEGVDLKEPRGQAEVALDHMVNYQKLDQQEALLLIKKKLEDGTLEDYSNKIHTDYNKMYDAELERIEQETIDRRKEQQERVKITRASLSAKLKEAKIKDSLSKKLIEGVTKVSKEGSTEVEKAFKTILENPEEHYEVLLHILDQKSFRDIYKVKKEQAKTEEVLKIFQAAPKTKKQQQRKNQEFLSSFEEELMDNITKLKN